MGRNLLYLAVLTFVFRDAVCQNINPAILQDSRDLPKVDGAFGFLYRTEDGIAHAAKGEPDGVIRGRFTYTDPTGLKVNYNYNAGSRVTPKYNYNEPLTAYEQNRYNQAQNDVNYQENYQDDGNDNYQQPQQQAYAQPQQQQRQAYQQREVSYQQQQDFQEQRSRPPHLRTANANY